MAETTPPTYALPRASPPWAVASLIISMAVGALGNGLMFAFIPLKLGALGYDASVPAWIVTLMAAGGFFGCLGTGPLLKRVGHARAYMTMIAVAILSHLSLGLSDEPVLWAVARFAYGFAATGFFITSQSWLNDACPNEWRGRVMGVFYMSYVTCIGVGGYLIAFIDLSTTFGPMLAAIFSAISLIPVGFTNLRTPPPPDYVSIAFRAVWRISPVGLAGALVVGGLTMLVQGFAPIYAQSEGFSQQDIALLVFLMQFGMIAVQMPLGALSDRMDRRLMLIAATGLIIVFAGLSSQSSGVDLWMLILLFGIWAGATEAIYSIANAHANDRAEPQYYVSLSATILFAWSLSGFLVPGAASTLMSVFGVTSYMYLAIAVASGYGLFVLWRMTRRDAVPSEDTGSHEPRVPQAYNPELIAPVDADDVDQEVPDWRDEDLAQDR